MLAGGFDGRAGISFSLIFVKGSRDGRGVERVVR